MLLNLADIAKVYGNRVIFKGVNLQIAKGTVTLLAGPNGAGKSTLLRIMAGLTRPTSGTIQSSVSEENLGYLGHATFVYPGLTAWENLIFWAKLYHLAHKATQPNLCSIIQTILDRVDLLPYAHERAGFFSRGMAQRLNLARILMLEPSLILLDEPSTGLDTRSAQMLRHEITTARQGGAGIVWISHDVTNDALLADNIVVLDKARVHFNGTGDEYMRTLKENFSDQHTLSATCPKCKEAIVHTKRVPC